MIDEMKLNDSKLVVSGTAKKAVLDTAYRVVFYKSALNTLQRNLAEPHTRAPIQSCCAILLLSI